jgi:hypothetical protein
MSVSPIPHFLVCLIFTIYFSQQGCKEIENAVGRSKNSHYINLLLFCSLFKFYSILLLAEYTFDDVDRTMWNQPKLQLLAPWL